MDSVFKKNQQQKSGVQNKKPINVLSVISSACAEYHLVLRILIPYTSADYQHFDSNFLKSKLSFLGMLGIIWWSLVLFRVTYSKFTIKNLISYNFFHDHVDAKKQNQIVFRIETINVQIFWLLVLTLCLFSIFCRSRDSGSGAGLKAEVVVPVILLIILIIVIVVGILVAYRKNLCGFKGKVNKRIPVTGT